MGGYADEEILCRAWSGCRDDDDQRVWSACGIRTHSADDRRIDDPLYEQLGDCRERVCHPERHGDVRQASLCEYDGESSRAWCAARIIGDAESSKHR